MTRFDDSFWEILWLFVLIGYLKGDVSGNFYIANICELRNRRVERNYSVN